jgi:peptidoglycan hydrolase FlgJ
LRPWRETFLATGATFTQRAQRLSGQTRAKPTPVLEDFLKTDSLKLGNIKVKMMKMAFDPQILRPPMQTPKENVSTGNNQNSLKQLCQDFESIFINSLFQEMRKSIPDEGYLEHSLGMNIFQEMMDMEVAGEMSRKGGLGLGRLLYEQLRDKYDLDKEK